MPTATSAETIPSRREKRSYSCKSGIIETVVRRSAGRLRPTGIHVVPSTEDVLRYVIGQGTLDSTPPSRQAVPKRSVSGATAT